MSGNLAMKYMPQFLTFAHNILSAEGIEGEDTAYLPMELGERDFLDLLEFSNEEGDPDIDVWCIRYGALIALFCNEMDRVSDQWLEGPEVAKGLKALSTSIPWIRDRPDLRRAVDSATADFRKQTIDKIVRLTLLEWWSDIPKKWAPHNVSA